ncbi:dipeptidase [Hyphococcus sp.]|uniref:dipeptidase n=1 Tax=Hyphococcus sp. TaxID=2038636 RepID=UPI00375083B5
MFSSRRRFMQAAGAATLTAGIAGCGQQDRQAQAAAKRRLMINGNMVIAFDGDGVMSDGLKEKIRESGLTAIKISMGGSGGSYADTLEELAAYDKAMAENADILRPVTSVADIDEAYASQRLGIIKSFEAATMHEGQPARIAEFAALGVKVMQLGYNNTGPFGAGVMSVDEPLGLSDLGREAVSVMEQNGVLLDLSHAHERTMFEAIAVATRPVAVTHSGCAGIYAHQRNKSDEALKRVADTGGVVGIYELSYLTPDDEQTPLSAYLAHLEHALKICGEDHVGIGSDAVMPEFDVTPESIAQWDAVNAARKEAGVAAPGEGPMPFVVGLNGPQRMHVIADNLKSIGYGSTAIDKIMGLNFKRLFAETWTA